MSWGQPLVIAWMSLSQTVAPCDRLIDTRLGAFSAINENPTVETLPHHVRSIESTALNRGTIEQRLWSVTHRKYSTHRKLSEMRKLRLQISPSPTHCGQNHKQNFGIILGIVRGMDDGVEHHKNYDQHFVRQHQCQSRGWACSISRVLV
eukprot:m.51496 g.51496  ORF g.51496 m.51496 type:complete len:149 (+) comp21456_c0_seq1:897-1343(+)